MQQKNKYKNNSNLQNQRAYSIVCMGALCISIKPEHMSVKKRTLYQYSMPFHQIKYMYYSCLD